MCAALKNNVRVNSVHPGFVQTTMMTPDDDPETKALADAFLERTVGQTPIGRIGQPEDIVGAILYLASDASKFTTGSELTVDGGFTAR